MALSPLAQAAGSRPPLAVTRRPPAPASLDIKSGRPQLHVAGRPPVHPAGVGPADPYDQIIAGLPHPLSNAQIQAQATGEISPLLAAVTGNIGRQTAASEAAIRGYSADAAAKMQALDLGAPFAQAETGQAAVDAALQQSLSGAGSSDAQSLSSRLAILNDPSVAQAAGGLAAAGTAAGNTALASGSSSLGNLLADAASSRSYGAQLPGIARSQGLQELGTAAQQGVNQEATQSEALQQQLPSIIASLTSDNASRSAAITGARENQLARNDAIASGTAANTVKVATVNANNQTKLQIADLNASGRVTGQQLAQARSDRTYRLQFTKVNGYDPVTGRVAPGFKLQGGQIIKTGTTKPGSAGGLTPIEVQKYKGTAATLAYQAKNGFTDTKTGKAYPAIDRAQALEEARKEGIPDSIALVEINRLYGTPLTPRQAKTAKGSVKPPSWISGG